MPQAAFNNSNDIASRFARPQQTAPAQPPVLRQPQLSVPEPQLEMPVHAPLAMPQPQLAPAAAVAQEPSRRSRSLIDSMLDLIFVKAILVFLAIVGVELAVQHFTRPADLATIVKQAEAQLAKFEYEKAYETIKPAARAGYPPALRTVANILYFTPSEVNNTPQAYSLLWEAAKRGDAAAQVQYLGYRMQDALDPTWRLQRQADLGDATAMLEVSEIFSTGRDGIRKRPNYSRKMMLAAADAHNVRAQYTAGMMYLNGKGTKMDREKGAQMILASANAGFKFAYPEAAKLFVLGRGVPLNSETALKWIIITKNTPGMALDNELQMYLPTMVEKLTQQQKQQAYSDAVEFVNTHPQNY